MPIISGREHIKLKIVIAVMMVGGVVWAELGQNTGTCLGVPDLGERFGYVIVPYALLAIGLLFFARSRADLIVLLVCSALVVTANLEFLGVRDELGLICVFVPIEATVMVVAALVVIVIRRLMARWLKGRRGVAVPVQNRLP